MTVKGTNRLERQLHTPKAVRSYIPRVRTLTEVESGAGIHAQNESPLLKELEMTVYGRKD